VSEVGDAACGAHEERPGDAGDTVAAGTEITTYMEVTTVTNNLSTAAHG
jgi:hypothetical protein